MGPENHSHDVKKVLIRVILLLIILGLSTAVFLLWDDKDIENENQKLELVSELISADHVGAVGGIRQLLTAMSVSHESIKDEKEFCKNVLTKESIIFPYFLNIGAVDLEGRVVCSGNPVAQDFSLAEDPAFQELLRTQSFTVSGSVLNSSGWPAVRYFEPHINSDGEFVGAFFATFATQWLNSFPSSFMFPSNLVISKYDKHGNVFMRYPHPTQWSGTDQSDSEIFQAILEVGRGMIYSKGLDGVLRKYYVRPIMFDGKIDAYVAIGADA